MSQKHMEVANYWNRRPCNVRHSDKPVGSLEYSNEVMIRRYLVESHIPEFADFSAWRGKKVLDIGCGIGSDTIQFAMAGARVTAVDISGLSLNVLRKRAEVHHVSDRIHTILGDMEELPVEVPNHPDLIWAWGSIHHTPNPSRALEQIWSLAGPKTVIRLMLYNGASTKALALRIKHGAAGESYSEAQEHCPVSNWYWPGDAVKLVESAGLEVTKLSVDHIFPYDVTMYRAYVYQRRFPWNVVQGPAFRWLEKKFGWHILLEAKICDPRFPSVGSVNSVAHSPRYSPTGV